FMNEECNSIIISNNTIYSVQTMQVHYMTYDLQHKYDTINHRTHRDVMVLLRETRLRHPYWYACVLSIFHMEVWLQNHDGSQPVKWHLEVLWVRWLAALWNYKTGIKYNHLPKLAFVEESDTDAFRFLNPGQVI
ncbi:hypothetical protein BDR04DRAFT_1035772, partial [Suillus decipiens]